MKKIIFFIALVSLFTTSPVFAQDATSSPDTTTRRRSDKPENVQIQEVRQELKADLKSLRSQLFEDHAKRLDKRFSFYFKRFTNIIDRFQTRLDTLKASGKNTSLAQAKLDLARTKLASAKTKGDQAIAAFKSQTQGARDLALSARSLYIEVGLALKDALKELKLISPPPAK